MEKYSSRRTGWRASARSTTAPHSNSERSAPISEERKNEGARSARAGVRDAADEPGLSDRAISVLSSRISHHHVSHGPRKLRELVPEPLEVDEPLVKFEFIRMPDSTGFGDYTESGQVIPVLFKGRKGGYSHCMVSQRPSAHRRRARALGLSQ